MSKLTSTRRHFLQLTIAGTVAGLAGPRLLADDSGILSEDDPMAIALSYIEDVNTSDMSQVAGYVAGSDCSNCLQFKGKNPDQSGACALFPGKKVPGDAWCKAWAKK